MDGVPRLGDSVLRRRCDRKLPQDLVWRCQRFDAPDAYIIRIVGHGADYTACERRVNRFPHGAMC
jgi:hypothetical protein